MHILFWTNIRILVSAKCLDSPCTVCFLLPSCSIFNGMFLLLLSCYCCYYLSSCIIIVCFAPWFPLDCFISVVLYRVVACFSLCTRNSFFIPPPSSLNFSSLFCLFSGRKSPGPFPDSFVLWRFTRVLLSKIVRSRLLIH